MTNRTLFVFILDVKVNCQFQSGTHCSVMTITWTNNYIGVHSMQV